MFNSIKRTPTPETSPLPTPPAHPPTAPPSSLTLTPPPLPSLFRSAYTDPQPVRLILASSPSQPSRLLLMYPNFAGIPLELTTLQTFKYSGSFQKVLLAVCWCSPGIRLYWWILVRTLEGKSDWRCPLPIIPTTDWFVYHSSCSSNLFEILQTSFALPLFLYTAPKYDGWLTRVRQNVWTHQFRQLTSLLTVVILVGMCCRQFFYDSCMRAASY